MYFTYKYHACDFLIKMLKNPGYGSRINCQAVLGIRKLLNECSMIKTDDDNTFYIQNVDSYYILLNRNAKVHVSGEIKV